MSYDIMKMLPTGSPPQVPPVVAEAALNPLAPPVTLRPTEPFWLELIQTWPKIGSMRVVVPSPEQFEFHKAGPPGVPVNDTREQPLSCAPAPIAGVAALAKFAVMSPK